MKGPGRAFQRGREWPERRKQLAAQRAFTREQLKLKEGLLEGALVSRRTGTGASDQRVAELMRDWLLIHEELEGGQ